MIQTNTFSALGLAVFASACATTTGEATQLTARDPDVEELRHGAGGFLEHARSPLVPFCHGVLVASDVVITSAGCVEEGWWELSFGVGEVGSETIPVEDAILHPLAGEDPHHALVALVLERPVQGFAPAATMVPEEATPCGVEIPSYDVVLRGDSGERHIWTACGIEPNVFVSMEGFPNCHGDSGAGAFDVEGGEERVIGWVTGAGHLGPMHPIDDVCVTDVELATVGENLDFLSDALALSRFPVAH